MTARAARLASIAVMPGLIDAHRHIINGNGAQLSVVSCQLSVLGRTSRWERSY
jgi:predicted amidohydrolase YtcJ